MRVGYTYLCVSVQMIAKAGGQRLGKGLKCTSVIGLDQPGKMHASLFIAPGQAVEQAFDLIP
jgi:hypothetical protein